VFIGEHIPIPWTRGYEHANHIGHSVSFMNAVFVADPDRFPGPKGVISDGV